MNRTMSAGFVLPAIAALLVGCSPAEPGHNAADITFAQDMIPHHEQAVEMARPVPQHTGDARVITLADRIRQVQKPEIDQLESWLQEWGVPAATSPGGMRMPGMVDTAGLARLTGVAYDRKWLELMIAHHAGAVTMARTELAQGSAPDVKAMARHIVDTQQGEIASMKGILGD